MPKVDIPLTFIKSAAVGGIAMVWVTFTVKAFKIVWHIISTSSEEQETWEPIVKKRVMCEQCNGYFWDDGLELKQEKLLCEVCLNDLVRDEL